MGHGSYSCLKIGGVLLKLHRSGDYGESFPSSDDGTL